MTSKGILTAILIIITLALGVGAIYIGLTLSSEESDTGADQTEAAYGGLTGDCGGVVYPPGLAGCIQIPAGCSATFEIHAEDASPGSTDVSCLGTNSLSPGQGSVEGPTSLCPENYAGCEKCVQVDIGGEGGSVQYTEDCDTGDDDDDSTGGCGDNWCSAWEKVNNRCEMRTWRAAETAVPWSCKDEERIADCRSDCTWCGDGVVQFDGGEECDPGDLPTESCDVNCQKIVVPQSVVCGESCTTDSDCDETGVVCNDSTQNDSRYPLNTCVLQSCLATDASCSSDGCSVVPVIVTPLPKTAIIDDRSDAIILSVMAIISGILIVKFDIWGMTKQTVKQRMKGIRENLQTGKMAYVTAPVSSKAQKEVTDKKKKKFEKKIVD